MIYLLQSLGHKYFTRDASIPILTIQIYVRLYKYVVPNESSNIRTSNLKLGMCFTRVLVATRDLVIGSNLKVNHLIQSRTHIASMMVNP